MSEEDKELEQLKAKRLAEMQRNLSSKQMQESNKTQAKKPAKKPREILVEQLGFRGLEVLQNAESQFPNETKMVVDKLAELITSGEVDEKIDGGKLLMLFRSIGINVRMQTKINIEQDGKFVSLSDKLSTKNEEPSE
ncbi:MAG: double-stranded DNA-binding protein [Crenarchaeota archaeon]|nr:MAG: double-stranded DNA-binding protein [Thermoproteota archaeon]RDJ33092.1 MAG: double-stranded DNA-binding protein [Thermoproteota archaeon]RDJ36404.1 MAG: double-stranded DNA-binding protein [Thermoproteota archaeon]RDJ39033.1 MAG: double-stranded DNA-binding protein [Thermoproteota archaeon]